MDRNDCKSALDLGQVGFGGFGLIDFIIIGAVISILAFIVVTNIIAHAY